MEIGFGQVVASVRAVDDNIGDQFLKNGGMRSTLWPSRRGFPYVELVFVVTDRGPKLPIKPPAEHPAANASLCVSHRHVLPSSLEGPGADRARFSDPSMRLSYRCMHEHETESES
jgi:hypothetical protein